MASVQNRSPVKKLTEVIKNIPENRHKAIIREYDTYVRHNLIDRQNLTEQEEEIAEDYLQFLEKRNKILEPRKDEVEEKILNPKEVEEKEQKEVIKIELKGMEGQLVSLTDLVRALQVNNNSPKVNLNELVCKPETFNGYTPRPRDWIDSYEEAFRANEWSETNAVKYFPTFLRGAALDWFKTLIKPKLMDSSTWRDLRGFFYAHYLGKDELRSRRKEFKELLQNQRETSINFIPRAYKLLKLVHPSAGETEAVEMITDKLKPEVMEKLGVEEIGSIEELIQVANRIECTITRIKERRRKGNQPEKPATSFKQDYNDQNRNEGKQTGKDQSKLTCYRCYRQDHIARNCKETTTIDGKPCKEKRQARTNIRMIQDNEELSSDENVGESSEEILEENKVQAVKDQDFVSLNKSINVTEKTTKMKYSEAASFGINKVSLLCSPRSRMISSTFLCNSIDIEGLIDTGAYHSVIDEELAIKNKWKILKSSLKLSAAGNHPLLCIGVCDVNISLNLQGRERSSDVKVAVVRDLGTEAIIGLELLSAFKIIIDSDSKTLNFKINKIKSTGIRNTEKLKLQPLTQNVIEADVCDKGLLMTIPNYNNEELLVANSVSEVQEGKVQLFICNRTNKTIVIEPNTQLATYEIIESERCENQINRMIEIKELDSVVSMGDDLSERQVRELSYILKDKSLAFSSGDRIGLCKDDRFKHKIEIETDARPFNEPLRRRPLIHIEETRKIVNRMLDQGIIEESNSPWSSAYLLVKKKSGEYRLCIDFRKLNSMTKKLVYPLPNIEDCIDSLAGKKFFSLIDFSSGFWQVPMDDHSKELTSFKTEDGLFHFNRMPFGLANAPSSFQRMINAMLAGLKGVNLQVFIDDVCIASSTWNEHVEMISKVLDIVIKSNLTLKASKCIFGARRIIFLGHEISEIGIRQDPSKTRALIEMPRPKDTSGVRRALGMMGYYRKFIPRFADKSEPLTKLLKAKTKFFWSDEQETAFKTLLADIARNVILAKFNHKDPIVVKTDASKAGVAGLLYQKQNSEWRLVSCCSRRLSDSEINYGITDMEGLAIIYSVNKFRCYLLGKHFKILTDHSALKVLNDKTPATPRLKRWAIFLSEFDYEIIYTKGELHGDVDCLSRAPVDTSDKYLDDRVFLIKIPVDTEQWVNEYNDAISRSYLLKAEKEEEGFFLSAGVIYFKNLLYVPPSMVSNLLREGHATPTAGHGGKSQTNIRLADYWWPNKENDVNNFVANCETCLKRKTVRMSPAGTMRSFEIYDSGKLVGIDVLGPISETLKRNKYVFAAVDCFTRFIYTKATSDNSSTTYVDFLLEYSSIFGCPESVLTDNAAAFAGKYAKQIETAMGINHRFSTPSHSQGNAMIERAIQTIQEKLNLILNENSMAHDSWDVVLPVATLAINCANNRSTCYSPYELTFGKNPPSSGEITKTAQRTLIDMHARLLKSEIQIMRATAVASASRSQVAAKDRYDQKHRNIEYEVGDCVLIKSKKRGSKLDDHYEGKYEILERNNDIYKLKDPSKKQVITRHISDLKLFSKRTTANNHSMNRQSMILVIICCLPWQTMTDAGEIFELKPTGNLHYVPTKHNVIKSHGLFELKLKFANPCENLKKVYDINFNNQFIYDYTLEQKVHENIVTCQRAFNETIERPLMDIANTAKTRFARLNTRKERGAIMAIAAGLFISNIIDGVWDNSDDHKNYESRLNNNLEKLNNKIDFSIEGMKKLSNETVELGQKLEKLIYTTDKTTRIEIQLAFAHSYLISKIDDLAQAILDFKLAIISRRTIDLSALHKIIKSDKYDEINQETVVVRSFTSSKDTFELEFIGEAIDQEIIIFQAATFNTISNLTGNPTLLRYAGSPFVLYNVTNGCIVGIPSVEKNHLRIRCEETNGRMGMLDVWSTDKIGFNPFENPLSTTYHEILPNIAIYCFGRKIKLNSKTMDCPPFPIEIDCQSDWNTDDINFNGYKKFTANHTINIVTDELVSSIQSLNHTTPFEPSGYLRKLYEVKKELEKVREESLILTTPVGGVSYGFITKTLFGCLGCSLLLTIYIWRHSHRAGRKRIGKLMKHINDTVVTKLEGINIPHTGGNQESSEIRTRLQTLHFPYETTKSLERGC